MLPHIQNSVRGSGVGHFQESGLLQFVSGIAPKGHILKPMVPLVVVEPL
jgi:hypothetical protein